jgi:hypothetical protein
MHAGIRAFVARSGVSDVLVEHSPTNIKHLASSPPATRARQAALMSSSLRRTHRFSLRLIRLSNRERIVSLTETLTTRSIQRTSSRVRAGLRFTLASSNFLARSSILGLEPG